MLKWLRFLHSREHKQYLDISETDRSTKMLNASRETERTPFLHLFNTSHTITLPGKFKPWIQPLPSPPFTSDLLVYRLRDWGQCFLISKTNRPLMVLDFMFRRERMKLRPLILFRVSVTRHIVACLVEESGVSVCRVVASFVIKASVNGWEIVCWFKNLHTHTLFRFLIRDGLY